MGFYNGKFQYEHKTVSEIINRLNSIPQYKKDYSVLETTPGASVVEIYFNMKYNMEWMKLLSCSVVRIDGTETFHMVFENLKTNDL